MQGENVTPVVLHSNTRHLVQIPLVLRDASRSCLDNTTFFIELVHTLHRVAPVACNAQKLIVWVPLLRAGTSGSGDITKTIFSTRPLLCVTVEIIDIGLIVGSILPVPSPLICFCIEIDNIPDVAILVATLRCVIVCAGPAPTNFRTKTRLPKHRIQQNLQIMARRRITVQIEAPRGLQHPVQFDQPHGHHGEIGHHVIFAQKAAHRAQHLGGGGVGAAAHRLKGIFGRVAPMPCVVERLDLGGAA